MRRRTRSLDDRVLPDEMDALDMDDLSAWHVDLLGTWGEEETRLFLKHYADEETRHVWLTDVPDYDMPPPEALPYDRDRLLPECEW